MLRLWCSSLAQVPCFSTLRRYASHVFYFGHLSKNLCSSWCPKMCLGSTFSRSSRVDIYVCNEYRCNLWHGLSLKQNCHLYFAILFPTAFLVIFWRNHGWSTDAAFGAWLWPLCYRCALAYGQKIQILDHFLYVRHHSHWLSFLYDFPPLRNIWRNFCYSGNNTIFGSQTWLFLFVFIVLKFSCENILLPSNGYSFYFF